MAVGQLPVQVREFARYLSELLGRLDQSAGWCGVFWQRDPDGMRACLEGAEVPPWDVVQALLHDLAADRGIPEAERETDTARALHRASVAAYDARPGGRELLSDRLDMMLTEQRIALERQADLTRQLGAAADPDDIERINLDLAWVRDDHDRATARCAEIQERMDRLADAERPSWVDLGTAPSSDGFGVFPAVSPSEGPDPHPESFPGSFPDDGPHVPRQDPAPAAEALYGAAALYGAEALYRAEPESRPEPVSDAVRELIKLRGEGRSGEAHGVLVEAAGWPADRLPEFAVELHRAGLSADWATLLWEAASLPPDRLVALADALAGSGRADDCRKLLRQGVARPAPEIAESIVALLDAGREREARALLDSYLRVRTPEDVARCAHTNPHRLIPLLLETARGVSEEHHWDLVHALRVAGFSA
ncbi:hypothetical protein [Streptomyces sp. Je 1-369]|uniref:hypothetical protein n=1 Tax=Streptomyces sp. Je 1-369 TaxID=2966192 RepID=UPI002285DA3F|nr:hypothetical protein [Streptomyces sp. Je 1-369]WAL98821.1 hypothetical protein NOO62_32705 [Streptomyces sp. Je 1-369]